jgi:YfiH family protein
MTLHNLPGHLAQVPTSWLVPQWPAPPHVRALCTSRAGGASRGVYESFNLGLHVGDDPSVVQQNREALARIAGVRPVFLDQVHGVEMVQLQAEVPDGTCADGAYARKAGLACTVMVADCLPVLFCDLQGKQVAAVHAGWRGLLGQKGQGVLELMVEKMRQNAVCGEGQAVEPLLAWLGPCIGPRKFEVGDEVRELFVEAHSAAELYFQALGVGKWLADLQGLARMRLDMLGGIAVYGNDGSDAWCTVSQPLQFFSHRRDRVSGRMAACIWLSSH